MKVVTVVGARPQFIKAAAVSRVMNGCVEGVQEIIVHTGQHYDENMSKVFFDELSIPRPMVNLDISGGGHGEMTGRMMIEIEKVLREIDPDCVLVYGDTNSTLAAALVAAKLHIKVAHVEAGLRSFNMQMPEEINRILTDRVSNILFCPTDEAVKNLKHEGMSHGVHLVGDVMFDVSKFYSEVAKKKSGILREIGEADGEYVLATCHREENTGDLRRLIQILGAMGEISKYCPVVLPMHPRLRIIIEKNGLGNLIEKVNVINPVSYLDMVRLEQGAKKILTDSGGVQKEAYFYRVPCITMRDETEWVETVELGWNVLVGADKDKIVNAVLSERGVNAVKDVNPYGEGDASVKIVEYLRAA